MKSQKYLFPKFLYIVHHYQHNPLANTAHYFPIHNVSHQVNDYQAGILHFFHHIFPLHHKLNELVDINVRMDEHDNDGNIPHVLNLKKERKSLIF